jgi:hypothetical protein
MNESQERSEFLSFIERKAAEVNQAGNIAHWIGALPSHQRNLALTPAIWRTLAPHLEFIEQKLNSL